MDVEPIHEDLLENQNRSKPKHGHPDDNNDLDKKHDVSLLGLVKLFCQSCAQSGLQDPLNSLIQIEDHCAGGKYALPELNIVPQLPEERVGSKAWYAETWGSGVGSVFPFLAVEFATKSAGASRYWTAVRDKADSLPLLNSVLGATQSGEYLSHMSKTAMDGAIFGGAFVPVADPNKNFWQQKSRDDLSVAITFASQYGISHGVLNGIEKSGIGHMHFHEEHSLTVKSAAFHMGANLLGSSSAGLIGAETMSYLYGQGPARGDVVKNGVASFAVTGLFLDVAHVGEVKLVEAASSKAKAESEKKQPHPSPSTHGAQESAITEALAQAALLEHTEQADGDEIRATSEQL